MGLWLGQDVAREGILTWAGLVGRTEAGAGLAQLPELMPARVLVLDSITSFH